MPATSPFFLSVKTSFLVMALPVLLAACREEKPELDAASVARGQELIANCTACHNLQRSVNLVGPSLEGIVGRTSGTAEGYEYSEGIKAAKIVWTPEKIAEFLQDPFAMVPDTKMAVGELGQQEAIDIVTYIRSLER